MEITVNVLKIAIIIYTVYIETCKKGNNNKYAVYEYYSYWNTSYTNIWSFLEISLLETANEYQYDAVFK